MHYFNALKELIRWLNSDHRLMAFLTLVCYFVRLARGLQHKNANRSHPDAVNGFLTILLDCFPSTLNVKNMEP